MSKEQFHWNVEDYFPRLIQSQKAAVSALEFLVDDIHVNKELTIDKFLEHYGSEDFLWGLVKLMSSENLRISGNSAYVFGTIAESDEGIGRIVYMLNNKANPESANVLPYLVKLLKSADYECMMNAAGSIGTISEDSEGRAWLISQPAIDEIIELSTNLLHNTNIWVSSNAALVLARISIEDLGCEKLLTHSMSQKILEMLISSLGCDNAGRGMNCAFALGRMCDTNKGRQAILKLNNLDTLIQSLSNMVEQNIDAGCTKNACYALSCLSADEQAHSAITEHKCFLDLVGMLCKLLQTVKDPETQWFSAMLLRMFCSFPKGCVKMKAIPNLVETLNSVLNNKQLYDDVKEEINVLLNNLKPLEKPEPVKAKVLSSSEIFCEWNVVTKTNKTTVKYILFKDNSPIYTGLSTSYRVTNLDPFTSYSFALQLLILETNEKSELSDTIRVQTEEAMPSEPQNLKVVGATTSIIRLGWDVPVRPNGQIKSYIVYVNDNLVEQTVECCYTLKNLKPSSSYEVAVCATTCMGEGERAAITAKTCSVGEITPEKPAFGMINKREILVRWLPPQVIMGKLNRYELLMNGRCVYSGISQEHQVTMLRPDTEYRFEVIAITSEGKCKSKMSRARTLRDEYEPDRPPLYPIFLQKEKTDSFLDRRKSNTLRPFALHRQRSKPKFRKEKTSMIYEEFSLDFTKKALVDSQTNLNNQKSNKSGLPNLNLTGLSIMSENQSIKQNSNEDSSDYFNLDTGFMKKMSKQKTMIDNMSQNAKNPVSKSQSFNRSKSLINLNKKNKKTAQSEDLTRPSLQYVLPQTLTLNIREFVPKFPTQSSIVVSNGKVFDDGGEISMLEMNDSQANTGLKFKTSLTQRQQPIKIRPTTAKKVIKSKSSLVLEKNGMAESEQRKQQSEVSDGRV